MEKPQAVEPPSRGAFTVLSPVNVEQHISVVLKLLPASVRSNLSPPIRSLRRGLSNSSILRWRHGVVEGALPQPPRASKAKLECVDTKTARDGTNEEEADGADTVCTLATGASSPFTRPTTPSSCSRPNTSAGSSLSSCDPATSFPLALSSRPLPPPPQKQQQQPSPRRGLLGMIDERLKRVGYSLLQLSDTEAARRSEEDHDPLLERRVFLDGLTYLVRALPADLTDAEIDLLRASLPGAVLMSSENDKAQNAWGNGNAMTKGQHDGGGGGGDDDKMNLILPPSGLHPSRQTALYRSVRFLVAQMFVVGQLLLPVVVVLVRAAARADREYGVSAAVAGRGAEVAAALGRGGLEIGRAVVGAAAGLDVRGDGTAGRVVAWTIEGVAGGVADGVGEGLGIVSREAMVPANRR